MPAAKTATVVDGQPYWPCAKCGELKLASEFPRCKANASGLYSYCKACQNPIARDKARKKQKLFKKAMKALAAQK
jgi:hypothetical protein